MRLSIQLELVAWEETPRVWIEIKNRRGSGKLFYLPFDPDCAIMPQSGAVNRGAPPARYEPEGTR